MEDKILQLMKSLNLTRKEAIELIQEDLNVDKMEDKDVDNDLTKEQKKAIKQNTKASTGQYSKKESTLAKEQQRREEKATAMTALMNGCNVVKIIDKNSEFIFEFEGVKYRTVIKRVRKQK